MIMIVLATVATVATGFIAVTLAYIKVVSSSRSTCSLLISLAR